MRIQLPDRRVIAGFFLVMFFLVILTNFLLEIIADYFSVSHLPFHIMEGLISLGIVLVLLYRLLQSANDRYKAMFDEHCGIMLVIDVATGRIQDANRAAVDFYGYDRERLLMLRITDLNTAAPEQVTAQLRHVSQQRENFFESRHRLADGSIRIMEVQSSPILINQQLHMYAIYSDITRRKTIETQLLESEERFRSLVNSMDDMVFTLDLDQRYTRAYGRGIELTGFSAEQFLEKTARDIFGDEVGMLHEQANEQVLAGHSTTYEWSFSHEGAQTYIQTRVSPMFADSGNVSGIVGIGRDITELKRAKEQLEVYNLELERRVYERTERLDEMNALLLKQIDEREAVEAGATRQNMVLGAIQDISLTITGTLDLDQIFDRAIMNLSQIVPHDRACFALMAADGIHCSIQRSRGYTRELQQIENKSFVIADIPMLIDLIQTQQPILISDMFRYAEYPAFICPDMKSHLTVPIITDNRVIGFISLSNKQADFFSAHDVDRLRIFVNQIAIAIRNAQFHEQAKELAILEERQRLARDLHDALTQTLFSANVISDSLLRMWERDPEKVYDGVRHLQLLTRSALAEMRMLLIELRPQALVENPFEDLIQQLSENFHARTGIPVEVMINHIFPLPPSVKEMLYRIVQEALNNISKHAQASLVYISLTGDDRSLMMHIHDNGSGFDVHQVVSSPHMGLRIMRERAASIGAELTLLSSGEMGTRIDIQWRRPVHDTANPSDDR